MTFLIEVDRNVTNGTGALKYSSGNVSVDTPCWFEIQNSITAKSYIQCSATHMDKKKNSIGNPREGIYLPNDQTNRTGIFIHMGTSAAWSEGCIVIEEQELLKIWNSISPKDAKNVTVKIKNN